MELEQYLKLLNAHDWQYEYSDDSAMYYRGLHERQRLLAFASLNPELKEIFNQTLKKQMNHDN